MAALKDKPILKILVVLLVSILGLALIRELFFGTGYGSGIILRGNHEGGYIYMGTGLGFAGTISALLLVLIKVLFVLFIVGMIVGIAIAVKKYVFTAEDVEKIKSTFKGKKTVVIKETCSGCGKELNDDWKVCPHCGKEKETKTI